MMTYSQINTYRTSDVKSTPSFSFAIPSIEAEFSAVLQYPKAKRNKP